MHFPFILAPLNQKWIFCSSKSRGRSMSLSRGERRVKVGHFLWPIFVLFGFSLLAAIWKLFSQGRAVSKPSSQWKCFLSLKTTLTAGTVVFLRRTNNWMVAPQLRRCGPALSLRHIPRACKHVVPQYAVLVLWMSRTSVFRTVLHLSVAWIFFFLNEGEMDTREMVIGEVFYLIVHLPG